MTPVQEAAAKVEVLDNALDTLWDLRTEDNEELFEGLDIAVNTLEVIRDIEHRKVAVQENIKVNYSFTK